MQSRGPHVDLFQAQSADFLGLYGGAESRPAAREVRQAIVWRSRKVQGSTVGSNNRLAAAVPRLTFRLRQG